MVGFLRVVAVDVDGTIATGDALSSTALAALARFREDGGLVVLVTGRILAELDAAFPDVGRVADAIVAENGAVLRRAGTARRLAPPVAPELAARLASRGVAVRAGEVILAGSAVDRSSVLEAVRALGLDCQLVFNRTELMVLPSGVTKGTGLYEALGEMGVSSHCAVGFGDAENDRALLETCEAGVAVANAVPSLRAFADLVCGHTDGAGVAALLDDIAAGRRLRSRRRRLRLGTMPDGSAAWLPSSQASLLITGPPGSGKSHLAGLCAEQLIAHGYCVLLIDPEGDHIGLGQLRGAQAYSGPALPPPQQVVEQLATRFTSVVLDMSALPRPAVDRYLAELSGHVAAARRSSGLPHWIVADEAHATSGLLGIDERLSGRREDGWGHCLVTYRPDLLDADVVAALDAAVVLGETEPGWDPSVIAPVEGSVAELGPAEAYLVAHPGDGCSGRFTVGSRMTRHHRHWRKYTDGQLPAHTRFYARDGSDAVIGVAANLVELRDILQLCGEDTLAHHADNQDLSAWLGTVLHDRATAGRFAAAERDLRSRRCTPAQARAAMLGALWDEWGI